MKKQLFLSFTLLTIVGLIAKSPMLTPVKDTGHYNKIPTTMRVGQKFIMRTKGHGYPYDNWNITLKSGDAVVIANNIISGQKVIHAKKIGTSQIKVTGTTKDRRSNTAIRTIRVIK